MAEVVTQPTTNGFNNPVTGHYTDAKDPVDVLTLLLQKVAKDSEASGAQVSWKHILDLLDKEGLEPLEGVGTDTVKELLKFLWEWFTDSSTMFPTQWEADYTDLVYCSSVEEVQAKMQECLEKGKVLRTAGAQHSAPPAVFAPKSDNAVRVKLEGDLRAIKCLKQDPNTRTAIFRVGAGCNLGIDPSDPNSNEDNSSTRQLDAWGYALPISGGMSHQTLGGYMSTSTAGGSIDFGCADSILAIELVDGQGKVRKLDKATTRDDLNAIAVSMGLFGIFTYVTIVVEKKYLVKGKEEIVLRQDSVLASGSAFIDAVRQNEYIHNVWFAAEHVDSVLQ